MMHRVPLLTLAAILAGPLHAQDASRPTTTIEVGHERNHLDNGSPDWRETSVQLQHALGKQSYAAVGLLATNRFGLADTQVSGAYALPLATGLVGTIDASYSETHRVLARHSLGIATQYEFAPAWLVHTGLRNTRYDAVSVNQGSLGLERYVGDFSWMATWYPVRAFGTSANSYALRGNYYYSDTSFVGLVGATGQEATPIGANSVVVADVRSLALISRHTLSRTRQGGFYTRNGARIGAQYAF